MFTFLRETYAIAILNKKTTRLRKETGNPNLRSALDLGFDNKELLKRSILRPSKMLFLSPIVFLLTLYMSFVYGLLYLLFTTITQVFTSTYGFSQGTAGLAFLGLGCGMIFGVVSVGIASDKILKRLAAKSGVTKPEYRLPPMIVGGCLIPIGCFLYGWSANFGVQWMVPIIGNGFVGIGLISTFVCRPQTFYSLDSFFSY
jgi:hypothetical protein